MIRIEIDSTTTKDRNGTNQKGKPYSMREQIAYAHVLGDDGKPAKYPVKTVVIVEDKTEPYAPGFYTIDPRSVLVGDFDRLTLGRVRLIPEQVRKAS